MTDKARLLVVDDEAEICETMEEYFTLHGFEVRCAGDGQAMRAVLAGFTPQVVLLDLNLPGEDGLSLTRHLRQNTSAGIIMVTTMNSQVDKVVGLEMGADDYVGKPFDLRELLARVKSLLRRLPAAAAAAPAAVPSQRKKVGKCQLDLDTRTLWQGATEVPLTAMEYDLLAFFVANPGRPLSRERLLELSNRRGDDPFDRSVDSRITRLRKKIEEDPDKPQTIKTVRNVGYLFSPD
ncbi:response regulator [Massilia sp. TS11]|uniref:response regulator n=1 Tax=Massilia sp. TS11 TaxID=2908003 RepID=UPI001EDB0DA8|nr:response regulator transcription factor [Massilia sp. TS11]MCG2586035.1 response regulator transcription factor [Massilia sp. TS11]